MSLQKCSQQFPEAGVYLAETLQGAIHTSVQGGAVMVEKRGSFINKCVRWGLSPGPCRMESFGMRSRHGVLV